MKIITSDRNATSPQSWLTPDLIEAMFQRAFGTEQHITSARELPGGTFNTTFLITSSTTANSVLRIAPPPTAPTAWNTMNLMRREHAIQPFFAPLAQFMPRVLLADFTHQLLDRDYMFQTYVAGERWDAVADELPPDDQCGLWQQFGQITKIIHKITGDRFGFPDPGESFPTWSETVLTWLEQTQAAVHAAHMDAPALGVVVDYVRHHPAALDEITTPRLLHGDLWLFNILIARDARRPRIVGILDADRAYWGDPMADWTMFVLRKSDAVDMQQATAMFWEGYGRPEQTPAAEIRTQLYEALHAGNALVWAQHHDDYETMDRAVHALRTVADIVANLA